MSESQSHSETERHVFKLSDFTIIEERPEWRGADKKILKITKAGENLAAKLYMEEDIQGHSRDISVLARKEFEDYKALIRTPLGLYIPVPKFLLIDDNHNVIGFTVQWREGVSLNKAILKKPLFDDDIVNLEEAFMTTEVNERIPDSDMFNEANIMVSREIGKSKIWLAECGLVEENIMQYMSGVRKGMDYLRQTYSADRELEN